MKVLIQKVDMDTCLTAFILRVSEQDEVVVLQGDAPPEDLANPNVICIEVGGSGQTHLNNFDHHEPSGPTEPACKQAYYLKRGDNALERLVDYVSILDLKGGAGVPQETEPPYLSGVFSGMLLSTPDPKEQLLKGIKIFSTVLKEGIDPFGTMPPLPEWEEYLRAKESSLEQADEVKTRVKVIKSKSGLEIGYVESEYMGTVSIIYNLGCKIAVVYHPSYGFPPRRKFTIAGNDFRVDHLKPILNALEPGWGGPATGTILGSPKEGSKLTLEQVVEIVRQNM